MSHKYDKLAENLAKTYDAKFDDNTIVFKNEQDMLDAADDIADKFAYDLDFENFTLTFLNESINVRFIRNSTSAIFKNVNESNVRKVLKMLDINESQDAIVNQVVGAKSKTYMFEGVQFSQEQYNALETLDVDSRRKFLAASGLSELDADSVAKNLELLNGQAQQINESIKDNWEKLSIKEKIALLEELGYDKVSQLQYAKFEDLPADVKKGLEVITECDNVNESAVAYRVPVECYRNPWLTHKIEQAPFMQTTNFGNAFYQEFGTDAVNADIEGVPALVYVDENGNVGVAPAALNESGEVSSDDEFREYAKAVLKQAHKDNYDENTAVKVANDLIEKYGDDYGAMIGALTSGFGNESANDLAYQFGSAIAVAILKFSKLGLSSAKMIEYLKLMPDYIKNAEFDRLATLYVSIKDEAENKGLI